MWKTFIEFILIFSLSLRRYQAILRCQNPSDSSSLELLAHENFEEKGEKEIVFLIAGGWRTNDTFQLARYVVSIRSSHYVHSGRYFGDDHFCMGSIISRTMILTSAHCIMDRRHNMVSPKHIKVVAGSVNRLEYTSTTQEVRVYAIDVHKNFKVLGTDDVAILHLNEELYIDGKSTDIIKLPTGGPHYHSRCIILGWGRIFNRGPMTALPLQADVMIYSYSECSDVLPFNVPIGMLCAAEPKKFNRDPCRGDTGGPLICDDSIAAVISYRVGCGSYSHPSLYTDIWHLLDWIAENRAFFNHNTSHLLHISSLLLIAFSY